MGLLNKLFGFRWSLYVVYGTNQLAYVMHENNVLQMVGYVMGYYAGGARPVPPWSIHLSFNREHRSFELCPEHFTADGEDVTDLLIQQIASIDPGWEVKGGEPVFMDAATKKRLPLSTKLDHSSSAALMRSALAPRERTFFDVMDDIFGKDSA